MLKAALKKKGAKIKFWKLNHTPTTKKQSFEISKYVNAAASLSSISPPITMKCLKSHLGGIPDLELKQQV